MANPNVAQGTLNRLRGSLIVPAFPQLNVSPWNLGKQGMTFTPQGNAVLMIDTLTGRITSPEPYIPVQIHIPLLKTQNLSDLYKLQMESLATIGDCTFYTDSASLQPYQLVNCAIETPESFAVNGQEPVMGIMIAGTWQVNSQLYTLV